VVAWRRLSSTEFRQAVVLGLRRRWHEDGVQEGREVRLKVGGRDLASVPREGSREDHGRRSRP
jgi:hypothetical protein